MHFQAEIFAEIGEVIIGQKQAQWEKTTLFKSVGKLWPWCILSECMGNWDEGYIYLYF